MNQTATAARPLVRPFIALDRVDKAREIYRLSRLGLRVKQMAADLEVDADLITTIAREEGIVLRNHRRQSVIKSAGALACNHTTILSSLGHTNKNRVKGKTVRPYIERPQS